MLLERALQPAVDPGWVAQVKWDGVRNLTLVDGGTVRHWSRRLRERTAHFPEFSGLARCIGQRRAVLDGEIIVLRGGKPSFGGVLERDLAGGVPDSGKVGRTPATLVLFDLLEYGEQELYRTPLEERLGLLERVVEPSEAWQVVGTLPGSAGPDLFQAAVEADLEGIVLKRLGSLYTPGTRSRDWLKCKRKQRMLAVVCGYTTGRPGGLVLGAYRDQTLRYIGRAGSGLKSSDLDLLKSHLEPAARPFAYEPVLRDRFAGPPGAVVWTAPRLVVVVEFSEWTEEGKLRDPVVVGFALEPPEAAQMP